MTTRFCECCGRTVTAEQDAEAKRLLDEHTEAEQRLYRARHVLVAAQTEYSAASKAERLARKAKLAQYETVHGEVKW